MAKNKVSKLCIDTAKEAMSRFTDNELSMYVIDIFNRAKSYEDVAGQAAMEKAIKEVGDEVKEALFRDIQIKANNASKFETQANKIKKLGYTLREILVRRSKNLANNAESAQIAARGRLNGEFYRELTDQDFEYLTNKINNLDITKALDGIETTSDAKKIAGQFQKYIESRTDETIRSNALPLEFINEDRFLRHIHDSNKLLSAGRSAISSAIGKQKYTQAQSKNIWRDFIKDNLDLKETFKHTDAMGLNGELIDGEVDRILEDIFDNIVTGRNDIFSRSTVVNGAEEIKKKRRMFFKFKDWRSFGIYNERYGSGDLYSALLADIHGSANKIGIAETLGSNPHQAYFDLVKVQQKVSPETASWRSKGRLWFRNTDLYFKEVMGMDKAPVSATLANFGANTRAITGMSRLLTISLQSTTDIAYLASYAARFGMSYMDSYGYSLKHIFNAYKTEDRKYIAGLFRGMLDSHTAYIGRFVDASNSSEVMNIASMKYYRFNGLTAFDKGNKISILHLMATHLGNVSTKSYNLLNEDLKSQLTKFQITPPEWNLLRKYSEKGMFTLDNVEKISDYDLRQLYQESDKTIPLSRLKTEIHKKVYSLFDVAAENAVLSPGAFERAWLHQGVPPGTLLGEGLRAITQFKSYPLAYIDRVLVNGFNNAKGGKARIGWALQMALATLPLSILSSQLNYLFQGKSFPDPREMSKSELLKFGMENIEPNLGIMLSIMDARNQNSGLISAQLKTPSVKLLSDAVAAPLALITGHPDAAVKAFKDAANHILPLQSIPILSPFMNQMLNQKSYLQSGQHQIYGK